jgi:uncharacterized OsmC-like protein
MPVKITLLSEESLRLEGAGGPLTIEAESADQIYSPFHMLASGLAVCTYSILVSWATNAKMSADDLTIDVEWTFAEKPHRVGELHLTFDWPSLPADRTETARRVAALCPIHASFHHAPTISVEAKSGTTDPTPARSAHAVASGA